MLATPAYLERKWRPEGARRPAHQAVVYTQLGNSWTFQKDGASASAVATGKLRFSAAEGIRAAVLADMGLAVASDSMFAPELESGEVIRVMREWQLPNIDLWAVFPTGRLSSAKARALQTLWRVSSIEGDARRIDLTSSMIGAVLIG